MQQHFIVCGLGLVGWRVLEYLRKAGLPVVAITNSCKLDDPRLRGARLIEGDFREQAVLERAGVATARGVLILTSDDLVNISGVLMVRHLNAQVRIVVRMFNQNLVSRLGKAVHNIYALSVSALAAPLLALSALTGEALGAFNLEDGRRQVVELFVSNHSILRDRTIAETLGRYQAQAVAHMPRWGPGRLLADVDPEARLGPGDRLVVCGAPRHLAPLLSQGGDDLLPHVLWAGWLRRLGRVAWRTFREIDPPVLFCALFLLVFILGSTLTFHVGMGKPLHNALFRTISVMATTADMHEEELDEPWKKVFVGSLRIAGAALTAAFIAIFTNYLLRARLGGALEIRRIPEAGHVIVAGLGNNGFRVVEELLGHGERVVAIERSRDSRFLATTRRLGVAVIFGDATVAEVLRQAHAGTARAVIAATDNELANLEIALLARELNPHQRVVVRLSDPRLAETLREAANVRLALSIPALAAPAFVASLFGDRVQSVFLVADQMLAVVDLVVQPDDPSLNGQTVRAVAIDYGMLPVNVAAADRSVRQLPALQRLGPGDRLTAITTLPNLERLLRRERLPADWAVDVTGVPLPARPWLAQLMRTLHGLGAEAAEKSLETLPLCLGNTLTRGQAEDLLLLVRRERIAADLRQVDGRG